MNNIKKTKSGLILLAICLIVSACGQKYVAPKQSLSHASINIAETSKKMIYGLSEESPMRVDVEAQTVTMLVKFNAKYLTESTRHGIVYKGGSNAKKSIFVSYVSPKDFYNALLKIKAKPGNNMNFDNKEKTRVSGDKLAISFNWAGAKKDYDINEVIKDSNAKQFNIHFGGNIKASLDKNTGCILCLDSCPVGIVSNSNYTYGAVEHRGEVKFTGNSSVLPADGSLIVVTFKLIK